MAKITKRTVDAATVGDRRFILWDDALKGFGLLVLPSGVKSYLFNYRNEFNRERRITIGKHSGGLTPDTARAIAEEYQRAVISGGDPLAAKTRMREAATVGELFDRYLKSEAFERKAATTQLVDRGRITHHLRPQLGKIALPALSMADVEKAHRAICNGKTAVNKPSGKKRGRVRASGGDGAARMSVRLLRAILTWGAKQGFVQSSAVNAAKHVEIGRDGRRTTIINDHDDYARLFKTLDRLTGPSGLEEGEKLLRKEVADAIRVIALTGARRGEILGLRWSHVDLKTGLLTLSAEEHKTGRKTGDARVIGLPSLAVSIISSQTPGKSNDLVFSPARGGKRMDLSGSWRMVRKAAKLPADLGLHGLRHSLASHMAMQGAAASEIMTALGHSDISTSQQYVHWANDQRQVLAEKAAAGITAAIRGTKK